MKKTSFRQSRPGFSIQNLFSSAPRRRTSFRHGQLEQLEERLVLSAPSITGLPSEITLIGGTPIHIALDGLDLDGDNLSYEVTSSSSDLTTFIPEDNDSLKMSLIQEHDDGSVTSFGTLYIELFEGRAPLTTSQIKSLAENGFYDGLTFHRIIDNFMMQGGDPLGTGSGGTGNKFADEFHSDLRHSTAGVLSMANSGVDTNDCQFFITDVATPWLDDKHSVFGFVTEGDAIRDLVTDLPTDEYDRPLETVIMESVEVVQDNENGVLMLSAPDGASGSAVVTVTVTDATGAKTDYDITVNYADAPDEWAAADPIYVDAGEDITIQLPTLDFPGIEYAVDPHYTAHPDLGVSVNSETGELTISTTSAMAGVHWLFASASTDDQVIMETQYIPVFVTPVAPELELSDEADTGSLGDSVTAKDNTDAAHALRFLARDVVEGTTLELYMDGELVETTIVSQIDQGDGSGTTLVVLETVPGTAIADGEHSWTLRQVVDFGEDSGQDPLISDWSNTVDMTIDTGNPVFLSTPPSIIEEGHALLYDVDTDDEQADRVVYSLADGSPSGMAIDPATGVITWTPSAQHVGEQTITVNAVDLAGNTDSQTFTLTVTPAGFSLVVSGDTSVDEENELSFDIDAIGDGVEGAVEFEIVGGLPAGANATLEKTGDTTARFTWTPTEADGPATFDVVIRGTDEDGVTLDKTVTITVGEVNTPPIVDAVEDYLVVDEGVLINNALNVQDADLPANDFLFELVGDAPAGAIVDPLTGAFAWTPGEAHGGGEYTFTVRATDSGGASGETTFVVKVNEVDSPPKVTAPKVLYTMEGQRLVFNIKGVDPDNPDEELLYQITSAIENGTVAFENHENIQGSALPCISEGLPGLTIDSSSGHVVWDVPEGFISQGEWTRAITLRFVVIETHPDDASYALRSDAVEDANAPSVGPAIAVHAASIDVRIVVYGKMAPLAQLGANPWTPPAPSVPTSSASGRSTLPQETPTQTPPMETPPVQLLGDSPLFGQVRFGGDCGSDASLLLLKQGENGDSEGEDEDDGLRNPVRNGESVDAAFISYNVLDALADAQAEQPRADAQDDAEPQPEEQQSDQTSADEALLAWAASQTDAEAELAFIDEAFSQGQADEDETSGSDDQQPAA